MGFANVELLLLSAIPLLLLARALVARPGTRLVGNRTLSTRTPRRGDALEIELRVAAGDPEDIVEVHAPIPDGFSLTEGSNVRMLTGAAGTTARFAVRAHTRGTHDIPPVRAEVIDPHGLAAPTPSDIAPAETIEVTPRTLHAQGMRRRATSRLLAERQSARGGAGSTDFRELRSYVWGDPPKSINWKATARRLTARGGRQQAPLVNEYEKEGRNTLLILLDAGPEMRVGTRLESALDHAVEGALAAARMHLAQGARVGAATFHAKTAAPAPPDAGSAQIPTLERALSPGEPDASLTPTHVISAFARHLAGARPSILVITRITPRSAPGLIELARRVRATGGARSLRLTVLDIHALELTPTPSPGWETARRIIAKEDEAAGEELAAAGALVVPWHPAREDVRIALLRRAIP